MVVAVPIINRVVTQPVGARAGKRPGPGPGGITWQAQHWHSTSQEETALHSPPLRMTYHIGKGMLPPQTMPGPSSQDGGWPFSTSGAAIMRTANGAPPVLRVQYPKGEQLGCSTWVRLLSAHIMRLLGELFWGARRPVGRAAARWCLEVWGGGACGRARAVLARLWACVMSGDHQPVTRVIPPPTEVLRTALSIHNMLLGCPFPISLPLEHSPQAATGQKSDPAPLIR